MTTTLPLVFNNVRSRYVQLTMDGSVGWAGRNSPQDVRTVQAMLNALTAAEGAPPARLAVDGMIGARTVDAIKRFQQTSRLPVADGSIEPGRNTIRALGECLNRRDALPRGLPSLTAPQPQIVNALSGAMPVMASPSDRKTNRSDAGTNGLTMVRKGAPTGWTIISSGGFDVSIGYFGAIRMNIYAKHDTEPGKRYTFVFTGLGVGLSALPVGLDVWFQDMKGYATDILYAGAAIIFGRNRPFDADAFDGLPAGIVQVGANVGAGWSGTACLFGAVTPVPEPIYGALMTGMQAGLPGAAINYFVGRISLG